MHATRRSLLLGGSIAVLAACLGPLLPPLTRSPEHQKALAVIVAKIEKSLAISTHHDRRYLLEVVRIAPQERHDIRPDLVIDWTDPDQIEPGVERTIEVVTKAMRYLAQTEGLPYWQNGALSIVGQTQILARLPIRPDVWDKPLVDALDVCTRIHA